LVPPRTSPDHLNDMPRALSQVEVITLGRGFIGVLYLGRDEVRDRDVIIKALAPDQATWPRI
jgi:hypothetical protein